MILGGVTVVVLSKIKSVVFVLCSSYKMQNIRLVVSHHRKLKK